MNKKTLILGGLLLNFFFGFSQNSENHSVLENTGKNPIMLLGVYHFNNPGMDTYNTETDNYESDKRQGEIKEVVELIREFNPTKILVEFSPENQPALDSLYKRYLDRDITLEEISHGTNEVFQIGFRLGKRLGGIDIIGIDHSGNWLAPYADFIADTLELDYYQKYDSTYAINAAMKNKLFLKSSVRENLIYLNTWEQILQNHYYYNNIAIQVKDTANIMFRYQQIEQEINGLPYQLRSFDFNNIGVEVVTEWYKRNLFIYRNIIENTVENDRVLVIIGSGHVFYLHQLLSSNPNFNLVSPNKFLN